MIKNIVILVAFCWMSMTHAAHPVAQESMGDAEAYKVESAVEEQEAQRSVAGAKIKKKKSQQQKWGKEAPHGEAESDVRYWKYSDQE